MRRLALSTVFLTGLPLTAVADPAADSAPAAPDPIDPASATAVAPPAEVEPDAPVRAFGYGMLPYTVDAGRWQLETRVANAAWARAGGMSTRTMSFFDFDLKVGVTHAVDAEVAFAPLVRSDATGNGISEGRTGVGDTTFRVKVNALGNDGGGVAVAVAPHVTLPTGAEGMGGGGTTAGLAVPVWVALPGDFQLVTALDVTSVPGAFGDDAVVAVNANVSHAVTGPVGGFVEWIGVTPVRDAAVAHTAHVGASVALGDDGELDAAVMLDPTAPTARVNPYLAVSWRR